MTRIVQVANFVTPTSGGLRTTLSHLAEGYAAHGCEVVQVVPGPRDQVEEHPWGRRIELASPAVPGAGYRVVVDVPKLRWLLESTEADRLEVHDRTTLRGLGRWARAHAVPSLVVSHERLDRWLQQWLSPRLPLRRAADRSNAALARSFDTVVCTTAWAAEEFDRVDVRNLIRVPLGVDLDRFRPRAQPGEGDQVRLVMASRLSKEKRPELAVTCLSELLRRGVRAQLVVAGVGPMRAHLEAAAQGLPVQFVGFVQDRAELASLLAGADVVLAPGPVETFGLAALEALACGTPVVVNRHSALPEVVGDAGRAAPGSGFAMADAVEDLLSEDEAHRRRHARARAELFTWDATVRGFLAAHDLAEQFVPA